jgi:hypothetical protein
MTRFDDIQYDKKRMEAQAKLKELFKQMLLSIRESTETSREQSLAITNLEQAYMWAGEALKHDQEKVKEK